MRAPQPPRVPRSASPPAAEPLQASASSASPPEAEPDREPEPTDHSRPAPLRQLAHEAERLASVRDSGTRLVKQTSGMAVTLTERIAERARAARHASLRRLALVLTLGAVGVALVWAVFFSPLFALRTTQVAVQPDNMDAQVHEVVDAWAGVPLTRLSTSTVAQALKEVPLIKDATVSRSFPHGLSVTLELRQAVAQVPVDGTYQLYDDAGVAMGVSDDPIEGLPTVETEVDESTGRVLTAILSVLGDMPEELRSDVAAISATSDQTITFTLTDGAVVRWGDDSENELKSQVLLTLRQIPASEYDVSAPRTPVTS